MASQQEKILGKIRVLLTQSFDDPDAAFKFFDEDEDGVLDRGEIKKLLKDAKIKGFLRGVVASKLIEKFDESGSETIDWPEFEAAVDQLT